MKTTLHLRPRLLAFLLFAVTGLHAQEKTVYLSADSPPEEEAGSGLTFGQIAFSIPFNANPNRGTLDPATGENEDWFIPDGLSLHGGYGIHLKKWAALSANTGIDWRLNQKLASVPVYAMLSLNPHFNKENSVLLQAGLGQAFALGRGNLNGTYQKYRIGILFDSEILLFLDASLFGYPLKGIPETGSFTIGVSLLRF